VQDAQDLKRRGPGRINDQPGIDTVEKDCPGGEVRPAMADPRHTGQVVQPRKDVLHDPVGSAYPLLFNKVQPNRVDIRDRFVRELKGIQRSAAKVREMRFAHPGQPTARFLRPVDFAGAYLGQCAVDFRIERLPFFVSPRFLIVKRGEGAPDDLLGARIRTTVDTPLHHCLEIRR
jgi:hypothetical protein